MTLLSKLMTGDIYGRGASGAVFKGGGGGSQTTASGIDPEFKPHLQKALGRATSQLEGELDNRGAAIAGLSPEQMEAQAAAANVARQRLYDETRGAAADRALQNLQGSLVGQASGSGTLGSARQMKAREAALADAALQLQDQDYAARQQAAGHLGAIGAERQAQFQRELDAPHTSLSRYFGYLGNAPQQQTTTTSKGGK